MFDQDLFLQRALLREGLLDSEKLELARRYGIEHSVDLADALIQTEVLTSHQIALIRADALKFLADQWATMEPDKSFPIALLNRTEIIDRERVEFLISLA